MLTLWLSLALLADEKESPFDQVCARYQALKAGRDDDAAFVEASREVFEARGKPKELRALEAAATVSPLDRSEIYAAVAAELHLEWKCPAWETAVEKLRAEHRAKTVALWKKAAPCFCGAFQRAKAGDPNRALAALRECDAT